MTHWSKVLASKSNRGLGVSSFYALNRGLLFKWIWRFLSRDQSLWAQVIHALHGSNTSTLSASYSSLWSSIIKECNALKSQGLDLISHCKIRVGNGMSTSFWHDQWLGDSCLRLSYPRLFALENNKVCSVAAKMSAPFVSSLRRDVRGGEESAQLSRISDLLDTVVLSNMGDRRFWDLNGDGCFRVKDVRRLLDDMLLPKSDVPSRWVKQIPIKVNVLAWKISMDRLPTRVNLHRRGVQVSPISCPICCEALENLDHLLFCCDLAKDIARSICNWWGLVWNPVDSYRSWLSWFNLVQLQSSSKQVLEGVFYTSWWSIWSYRNHLLFSDSNLRKDAYFPAPAGDSEAHVLADWNAVYDAHNEVAFLMLGKEGKPVGPYVIKMKNYEEQLECLGYVLPQDLSVGLILNGLTSDFSQRMIFLYFNAISSDGIYETDVLNLVPNVNFMIDTSLPLRMYLLKHKHEVFETFKMFKNEIENQLGKTIKAIRSDRRGKYISHEFNDYLKACGIVQQLTPPYTPQHNGVSERRNRTLLDMARSMMNLTTLPLSFWDYALESAASILNMVPKKVDKTPYELWSKRLIGLSQYAYMDEILKGSRWIIPNVVISPCYIMYAVRCTRPDVAFAQNLTSRFQQNPGEPHWTIVKTILKIRLRFERKRNGLEKLQNKVLLQCRLHKLNNIAASEAEMEVVWIVKFISGFGIVPTINEPIKMFCDNSAALLIANESGIQRGARHYHRRYHYVRECIKLGEINLLKVHTDDYLADLFMNALPKGKLTQHARSMGLRLACSFM
ncbi:RNA-directed DNA polymerase, eukaryota [Tanacetum coccineum]